LTPRLRKSTGKPAKTLTSIAAMFDAVGVVTLRYLVVVKVDLAL
jgi:hypothetical protein